MDAHNLLPIGAILAAATILVVVLWRLMRPHVPPKESERDETWAKAAGTPHVSAEDAEYLDSSHIITAPPREPPR